MNTNAEIWVILGTILLMTYYNAYQKSETVDLWAGITEYKPLFWTYVLFIVISFFMGIWLMAWSIDKESESDSESDSESGTPPNKLLTMGILFLVGFSIGWVPMTLAGNKKLTFVSLLGAATGAGIILYESTKELELGTGWNPIIPASILMFQTGFLDLIVWNLFYNGYLKK
jgi:hypothetical protein